MGQSGVHWYFYSWWDSVIYCSLLLSLRDSVVDARGSISCMLSEGTIRVGLQDLLSTEAQLIACRCMIFGKKVDIVLNQGCIASQ